MNKKERKMFAVANTLDKQEKRTASRGEAIQAASPADSGYASNPPSDRSYTPEETPIKDKHAVEPSTKKQKQKQKLASHPKPIAPDTHGIKRTLSLSRTLRTPTTRRRCAT